MTRRVTSCNFRDSIDEIKDLELESDEEGCEYTEYPTEDFGWPFYGEWKKRIQRDWYSSKEQMHEKIKLMDAQIVSGYYKPGRIRLPTLSQPSKIIRFGPKRERLRHYVEIPEEHVLVIPEVARKSIMKHYENQYHPDKSYWNFRRRSHCIRKIEYFMFNHVFKLKTEALLIRNGKEKKVSVFYFDTYYNDYFDK